MKALQAMIYLELQLHGGERLPRCILGKFLDVGEQTAGWDLRAATDSGLQQGLVNENVLVLGLDHVVPGRTHAGHMTVGVHRLLVLDPLQHGFYDDEAAGPAHSSTEDTAECIW